ncbi:MAG: lipopolysaccharide transport periplasmic protein LptA [Gammaproteobacteria bacterium]
MSTDKDKDIDIEANSAELDNNKGVTVYRGNVVVTQGSIRMTGDIMTVYFTEYEDLDTVIMEGKPATYKQLPDNSKIYDEAEALRMEYYELKSLIILIDNALVKQEGLRFGGNRIEYDTEHSRVKARGSIKQTVDGDTDTQSQDERVKITIKSKKKKN